MAADSGVRKRFFRIQNRHQSPLLTFFVLFWEKLRALLDLWLLLETQLAVVSRSSFFHFVSGSEMWPFSLEAVFALAVCSRLLSRPSGDVGHAGQPAALLQPPGMRYTIIPYVHIYEA